MNRATELFIFDYKHYSEQIVPVFQQYDIERKTTPQLERWMIEYLREKGGTGDLTSNECEHRIGTLCSMQLREYVMMKYCLGWCLQLGHAMTGKDVEMTLKNDFAFSNRHPSIKLVRDLSMRHWPLHCWDCESGRHIQGWLTAQETRELADCLDFLVTLPTVEAELVTVQLPIKRSRVKMAKSLIDGHSEIHEIHPVHTERSATESHALLHSSIASIRSLAHIAANQEHGILLLYN